MGPLQIPLPVTMCVSDDDFEKSQGLSTAKISVM
jgi:hypothetical protein